MRRPRAGIAESTHTIAPTGETSAIDCASDRPAVEAMPGPTEQIGFDVVKDDEVVIGAERLDEAANIRMVFV